MLDLVVSVNVYMLVNYIQICETIFFFCFLVSSRSM